MKIMTIFLDKYDISPFSDFLSIKAIYSDLKNAEKRRGIKDSQLTMADAVSFAFKHYGMPKLVDDKGFLYFATELEDND